VKIIIEKLKYDSDTQSMVENLVDKVNEIIEKGFVELKKLTAKEKFYNYIKRYNEYEMQGSELLSVLILAKKAIEEAENKLSQESIDWLRRISYDKFPVHAGKILEELNIK
jgi:hypothetical protein